MILWCPVLKYALELHAWYQMLIIKSQITMTYCSGFSSHSATFFAGMISRPIWGWFKPRDIFLIPPASHWMGLVPEFKYLYVNWLTRLNVSERTVLHPFCICTIDISCIKEIYAHWNDLLLQEVCVAFPNRHLRLTGDISSGLGWTW